MMTVPTLGPPKTIPGDVKTCKKVTRSLAAGVKLTSLATGVQEVGVAVEEVQGVPVLHHEMATAGVLYMDLALDLTHTAPEVGTPMLPAAQHACCP